MSNHLAIATVTATLQKFLQIATSVPGQEIGATTVPPNIMGTGKAATGLNVFLYFISSNPVWGQGGNMGGRSRPGEMAKKWRSALDLHYMISAYGDDTKLEPQCLIGAAIRALTDQRVLTKEMILETIADNNFDFLADSNLVDQIEEINIIPLDLSLEDLSKAWSVFFQAPYKLSVAYRASVVIIEGQAPSEVALPVRARHFGGVMPFSNQPKIDVVIAQAGKFEPILADSILLIQGKNLKSNVTQVVIDGQELKPTEIKDTEIIVPLSSLPASELRAGIHSLQVIHRLPIPPKMGSSQETSQTPANGSKTKTPKSNGIPPLIPAVQSNLAPFTLRPTITKLSVSKGEKFEKGEKVEKGEEAEEEEKVEKVEKREEDEIQKAEVRVRSNLTIGKKQKVILALNEASINNPATYLFEAAPRRTDCATVTVPIYGVKPGKYLVRLQVDGAESQLTVDTKPKSKTFNQYIGPKITIK
ncbi:DUF4255 domain-containing protein [Limnofasciculus baicalensis]|uniref:DUF4255 domain-containing protein n=1 Tax=Limnofasciculus baicalensis BBK-W-15 TaxID=2699891 RepID=A0AAE3KQS7_9CYAN|nr:DUF4255 domain-containing protein [Limnofasciculus baicalensis]MCP2732151.1 DUF4255 domain-containing protein [Limnofasciculus baicalensis BBK-W-15]